MSPFLRIFQHLLPRSQAWRLSFGTTIRNFFQGLANWLELTPEPGLEPPRTFADLVLLDLFPSTTRQLAEWEKQFGLVANPSDAVRRAQLAAAWASNGGQSLAYIQGVLQTAGFNVYLHEWWSSGPPYSPRDPRTYTT